MALQQEKSSNLISVRPFTAPLFEYTTVSYTRGNDLSGSLEGAGGIGGLLAQSVGTSHNYYHADGNGNVTFLMGTNQTRTAWYRYDPFGNTIIAAETFGTANRYRFSSKMADLDTGLIYYGYRWYDPPLQRWMNRDPVLDGGFLTGSPAILAQMPSGLQHVNEFSFGPNSPLNGQDNFGAWWSPPNGWPSTREFDPESASECAERIFAEVGRTPGRASDPSSRYQHCLASCRISRECPGGRFTAWIAGDWYQDFWWQSEQEGSDPGDRVANKVGRNASKCEDKSCEESCSEALADGRLYAQPPPTPPLIIFIPPPM